MTSEEYWTMREIGTLFGATSHKVGKTLKDLGLRTQEGKPSTNAFEQGFVEQRWADDSPVYLWAWHKEKITALLEKAGFEKVTE
ncbi:MAG: hypothetical protein RBS80_18655 [Thermoguttaceae bacterium]|jgi:hypothetical protein|nr:hypothetical protein [Thermoguttaceae bacterium]